MTGIEWAAVYLIGTYIVVVRPAQDLPLALMTERIRPLGMSDRWNRTVLTIALLVVMALWPFVLLNGLINRLRR